nr:hypothetical protein [Tanacetum cinerariifolium]
MCSVNPCAMYTGKVNGGGLVLAGKTGTGTVRAGKGTWGGRVEAFWNSSHELQVHRKGKWGGLVLAGKLGFFRFGELATLVPTGYLGFR